MRKLIVIFLSMVFTISPACEKQEADKGPERLTVALIPKCTTHEFWKTVHAGGVKAARELDIDLIWKGPMKEDDREQQIQVVENFISRGVSGIVLAPLDEMALRIPVGEAVGSGIPVVIIDSAINSDDHVSFVATDNYKGGLLAGEHMAGLLGGKGRVIVLRYLEGSASTTKRETGFLETVRRYPDIEVVIENQYAGPTTETAYRQSENMLAPLKNQDGSLNIHGIFCPSESTTFGMLRALQDGGMAGTVRFVGFDSSIKLVQALRAGELDALVLQDPMNIAYVGVKTMVQHLKGEPVEKRIDTGATVVTKENMDRPRIKELLEPDLDKWLK
jgi:ribose transport system substrate-binding protein